MMREPILAGILSFLFLGLGQAYNGQRRKGYMFFASYPLLAIFYLILLKLFNEPIPERGESPEITSASYIITVICGLIIWIFNIYDAYQSTKRINDGEIIVDSTPGRSALIFLRNIALGFIAILVALPLIALLFGTCARIIR